MVKKTMAILGDSLDFSTLVMEILGKLDLQLLLVSEDETKNIKVKNELASLGAVSEIEFISCEREGCWEADIIAIARPENLSSALVEKIKEVATQKIVLVISVDKKQYDKPELKNLLPYSKVIEIFFETQAKKFSVSGKDSEALEDVQGIFERAGYQLNK